MNKFNTQPLMQSLINDLDNKDYLGALKKTFDAYQNKEIPSSLYQEMKGYIYLKKGDLGLARYYYDQAALSSGLNLEIVNNLRVIDKSFPEEQVNFLSLQVKHNFAYGIIKPILSTNAWDITLIILIFFTVTMICFMKRIMSAPLKGIGLIILLNSLFTLFLIVPKFFFQYGYIKQNESPIHEGPSEVFKATMTGNDGSLVFIHKSFNGWRKIIYPESLQGWINEENLLIVNPLKEIMPQKLIKGSKSVNSK